jgi:hypothetical protein
VQQSIQGRRSSSRYIPGQLWGHGSASARRGGWHAEARGLQSPRRASSNEVELHGEALGGRCCGCPALRSLLDLVCAAGALAGSRSGCVGRVGLAASNRIPAQGAAGPRSCAAPAWRLVNCIGLGCVRRAGGPRAGEGRWRRVGDGWAWCPRRSGRTLCARIQGGYWLRAVAGRRIHGRRSCGRRWVTGRGQLCVVSPSRLAPAQPFPDVPTTIAGLHAGDCTE